MNKTKSDRESFTVKGAYLRMKEIGYDFKHLKINAFHRISVLMFKELIETAINTGKNVWFPLGEITVRKREHDRAFHYARMGNAKERVKIPILDNHYARFFWFFKPSMVGVKIELSRKYKKILKQKFKEDNELYKLAKF